MQKAHIFLRDNISSFAITTRLREELRERLVHLAQFDDEERTIICSEKVPFSDFFLDYSPPKTKQPLDKYQPSSTANQIELTDFNFRLAIIQDLMYEQDLLPRFDVWEFCDQYTIRDIDIEEECYDVIPEVKTWFEALLISREMAGQTIFHCHLHLIPRYEGDMLDPRGGVRGVIPDKQGY